MQPIVYAIDADDQALVCVKDAMETAGMQARGFVCAEAFLQYRWRRNGACLIAEVDLPGISGLELLKLMNNMKRKIPTLFVTNHYEVAVAVEAVRLGADDLIAKPVVTKVLLHQVRRLLDQI